VISCRAAKPKKPIELPQRTLDLLNAAQEMAEELQNTSQACRRAGICRSQFYEIKAAFEARENGLSNLA